MLDVVLFVIVVVHLRLFVFDVPSDPSNALIDARNFLHVAIKHCFGSPGVQSIGLRLELADSLTQLGLVLGQFRSLFGCVIATVVRSGCCRAAHRDAIGDDSAIANESPCRGARSCLGC